MKFTKLDAVVSGLYNDIVRGGLAYNRELIEIDVDREHFDIQYQMQTDFVRDRLTKLVAINNKKINISFNPNMLNYNSFTSGKRLQVIVDYTVK